MESIDIRDMMYGGSGYVDLYGNPVSRNRLEYRYSYEPYVTHRMGNNDQITYSAYSDRLMQWDMTKFNKCCREVWNNEGQYFDNRTPMSIERFLQLYYDAPKLKLIVIMEGCNVSNGYPYWIFHFNK